VVGAGVEKIVGDAESIVGLDVGDEEGTEVGSKDTTAVGASVGKPTS